MVYIISLLALLLICNIKLYKTPNSFFNISLNTLLLVALYAVYTTQFRSIFIVYLVLFMVTHFNRFTLSYDLEGLKKSIIYSILTTPFIYLLQYPNLSLKRSPFIDDIHYQRVAYWIGESKIESSLSQVGQIYHTIFPPNYYHWFELWLTNMIGKLNHANTYINLYVVVITFVCVISCLGIHKILEDKFRLKSYKYFLLTFGSLFLFFCADNLFNFLSLLSDSKILKVELYVTVYNSLKLVFVFPISIALYLVSKDLKRNAFYLILFSFFYLVTFPPITLAIAALFFLEFLKERKFKLQYFLPILSFALFLLFYKLNGDRRMADLGNESLLDQIPNLSFAAKWFAKVYVFYIITWILPFAYLIYKRKELKDFNLIFGLIYLISSLLWLVLYMKFDSSQLFTRFSATTLCLVLILLVNELMINRKILLVLPILLISIFPFQKLKSTPIKDREKAILDISSPYLKEKIMYLTDPARMLIFYNYNEVSYSMSPELFQNDFQAQIAYISAAYPISQKFTPEEKDVIQKIYRKNSLYYKQCGEMDFKDYTCFIDFVKKYHFKYVFSEFKIDNSSLSLVDSNSYLFIYQIK